LIYHKLTSKFKILKFLTITNLINIIHVILILNFFSNSADFNIIKRLISCIWSPSTYQNIPKSTIYSIFIENITQILGLTIMTVSMRITINFGGKLNHKNNSQKIKKKIDSICNNLFDIISDTKFNKKIRVSDPRDESQKKIIIIGTNILHSDSNR
ncbi:hypothetical protein PanWU01x14_059910, partial [Parasponia andersonii]